MELSPALIAESFRQGQREQTNELAYKILAYRAYRLGYRKSSARFDADAIDEAEHAALVHAHLRERDVEAPDDMLPGQLPLSLPTTPTLHSIYRTAHELEKANTQALRELGKMADAEVDYPMMDLLTTLLKEQMRSEDELRAYVDQLNGMSFQEAALWDLEQ
jgi:ferritin